MQLIFDFLVSTYFLLLSIHLRFLSMDFCIFVTYSLLQRIQKAKKLKKKKIKTKNKNAGELNRFGVNKMHVSAK